MSEPTEISSRAKEAAMRELKDNADWIPSRERPNPYGFHVQSAIDRATAAERKTIEELRKNTANLDGLLGYIDSSKYFGAKEVIGGLANLDNWLQGLRERAALLAKTEPKGDAAQSLCGNYSELEFGHEGKGCGLPKGHDGNCAAGPEPKGEVVETKEEDTAIVDWLNQHTLEIHLTLGRVLECGYGQEIRPIIRNAMKGSV